MKIRSARPDDAARLLEIYAWYVENTAVSFEYDVPSVEAFRERMARTTRRYPWLVIEEDGRALGYAYAGPFKGRTAYDWSCETSVYLDRAARGRGLGRALVEALEAALGRMGIVNAYACIAWTEVEDETLTWDSARFHARLGYETLGRFQRCAYKFGRWYDMIWMGKTVGERRAEQPPVRPWEYGEEE